MTTWNAHNWWFSGCTIKDIMEVGTEAKVDEPFEEYVE